MERDGRIWRTGGRERVSRGTEKEGGRERERRCRIKGNDTCATVCRPDVRCFVTITYMPVFYIYAGRISARLQYLANAQTPRRNRARMWLGARHRVGIGHRDDSKGAEPRVPAFVNASLYAGAGNDVLIDSLPPSLHRRRPGATASAVGQNRKAPFPLARIACRLRLIPKCSDYGTGLSGAR